MRQRPDDTKLTSYAMIREYIEYLRAAEQDKHRVPPPEQGYHQDWKS